MLEVALIASYTTVYVSGEAMLEQYMYYMIWCDGSIR